MRRVHAAIGVLLLSSCASPDIAARGVGVLPLAETDEAGLWMTMQRAELEAVDWASGCRN